jgi:hypothetical protein
MSDTSVTIRNRDLRIVLDKFCEVPLVFNIPNLKGDLDPKGFTINKVADYITVIFKKIMKEKWDNLVVEEKDSGRGGQTRILDSSPEQNKTKIANYVSVGEKQWDLKNFMGEDTSRSRSASKDANYSIPLKANNTSKAKPHQKKEEHKSKSANTKRSATPEKKQPPGYMKSFGVRLEKQIRSNIIGRSKSPSKKNDQLKQKSHQKVS